MRSNHIPVLRPEYNTSSPDFLIMKNPNPFLVTTASRMRLSPPGKGYVCNTGPIGCTADQMDELNICRQSRLLRRTREKRKKKEEKASTGHCRSTPRSGGPAIALFDRRVPWAVCLAVCLSSRVLLCRQTLGKKYLRW